MKSKNLGKLGIAALLLAAFIFASCECPVGPAGAKGADRTGTDGKDWPTAPTNGTDGKDGTNWDGTLPDPGDDGLTTAGPIASTSAGVKAYFDEGNAVVYLLWARAPSGATPMAM
jgi:hypothetical protein